MRGGLSSLALAATFLVLAPWCGSMLALTCPADCCCGHDVDSVWSQNPYQFEVHVWENNRREFSATRVYRFELKLPLDPDLYRELKLSLFNLNAGDM